MEMNAQRSGIRSREVAELYWPRDRTDVNSLLAGTLAAEPTTPYEVQVTQAVEVSIAMLLLSSSILLSRPIVSCSAFHLAPFITRLVEGL